ncbi:MAG TPA: biotin-dependent carboxyltransferase family protein [Burkholderiales bacterium]|nr:biotin-dependent carboxyltransferase family protein [Burkholderiales bacterium]
MALKILRAGVLTTVQDLGRSGYQRFGVPVSGAMDAYSLRIANALVGNGSEAAGLELTLEGPAIEFDEDSLFAVCGADLAPRVADRPVPMFRPVWVRAGTRVEFGAARVGSRAYLAVAGGIDVAPVLGSRSTYLRANLGGLEGRALKRGDRLGVGVPEATLYPRLKAQALGSPGGMAAAQWAVRARAEKLQRTPQTLRFVSGGYWETLPAESRARFTGSEYRVGAASDRMGYRLEGAQIDSGARREVLSEAVAFGTIQLPPDGNPIVLMADRQVTGGYPRLGEVASVDLGLAAQLKPGDRVRFERISLTQAQQLWMAQERAFAELCEALRGHVDNA